MSVRAGPLVFSRFAFPPNSLGYCGPSDERRLAELVATGDVDIDEMRHVAIAFEGAWPYLELIGYGSGRDPLDPDVVEAYWLGSPLLERLDLQTIGNSMEDRFRKRAGWDWTMVSDALDAGGRPTHAFHVFCIYPWVGLLRSGVVDQALDVLDRCRIRWGGVVGRVGDRLLVESRPLRWEEGRLDLAPARIEQVLPPLEDGTVEVGDRVALHWDYACQRLTPRQEANLVRYHRLHLGLVNAAGRNLARRVES